jgi:hypothetical protein
MSFANLKRSRNSIDKLVQAAQSSGGGEQKSYKDERMWKPTQDKMGNGYAVIRFLPAAEGQDLPWIRYWDHGFKGPTGKWYIERSLTTIGQDDPVGKLNSKLWNVSDDDKSPTREQARNQKRRMHYVANVLVVSDPANPDNEGKVFMYQFGKKIFDKIMDVMQPQYADESPMNPFDFWTGANFKIKIRKVEGWVNYDKSEFDSPSELSDDDAYLEGIYNSLHDLTEFTDPKNFKSYAELEAKLNDVLGIETTVSIREEISLGHETPARQMREMPPQSITEVVSKVESFDEDDDTDDTMSYFAKLANG